MYGPGLKNVSIITLAPELEGSMDAIQGCVETGILVSLGHTQATLSEVQNIVKKVGTLEPIRTIANMRIPFKIKIKDRFTK